MFLMMQAPETAQDAAGGIGTVFSGTPWIDVVGFCVVGVFFLLGFRHGLVWQVFRLIGVVAALILARSLSPEFVPHVQDALQLPLKACQGIVWFLVFALTLVLASLVGVVARRTLEAVHLGAMDRMGGALAGALTGVIVHSALLVLLCSVGTAEWASKTFRGSASASMLDNLSRKSRILLDAQAAERIIEPWGGTYDAQVEAQRQSKRQEEGRRQLERAAEFERQADEERRRAAAQGYSLETDRRRPDGRPSRRGVR